MVVLLLVGGGGEVSLFDGQYKFNKNILRRPPTLVISPPVSLVVSY